MLNRRDISFLRHSISLHTPLSSDFQLLAPDVDLMLQEGDLRCRPFNRHFALSAARVTDRPCLGPNNSDSNPQWLQLSCGEYLKQAPVSSVSILSHSLPQPTAFRAFVLSFLYPLGTIRAGLLFLSSLVFVLPRSMTWILDYAILNCFAMHCFTTTSLALVFRRWAPGILPPIYLEWPVWDSALFT